MTRIKINAAYVTVHGAGTSSFAVKDGSTISLTQDALPNVNDAGWERFYAVGETNILSLCLDVRGAFPGADIEVHRPNVFITEPMRVRALVDPIILRKPAVALALELPVERAAIEHDRATIKHEELAEHV